MRTKWPPRMRTVIAGAAFSSSSRPQVSGSPTAAQLATRGAWDYWLLLGWNKCIEQIRWLRLVLDGLWLWFGLTFEDQGTLPGDCTAYRGLARLAAPLPG